jgi:hypothetical protein
MAGKDVAEKKVMRSGFMLPFQVKTDMIFLFELHAVLVRQM